jgi:hypothetical protein
MKILGIILIVFGGLAIIGQLVGGHGADVIQLVFEIGIVILGVVLHDKGRKNN